MDFFAAQDQARRNTGRLVLFFTLAVLSLIVMTNLLVMTVLGYFNNTHRSGGAIPFDWQLFWIIGGGVILVILVGSLYKISALSGGGDAVAAMLGGEPIFADGGDLDQQKVVNVVEEMAIASGVPVPQVYLIDEDGINAFAAGFSTSDAVIGVTRGAIRNLNREQLQGVIAHEFSHILNGDMRLNIRLIGILHGILLLGLIGYHILRGSSRSSSSRKGGGGALALGLGLVVIGYAGTFFGKLIKAAVSRQREFLADSSAVQFTRNPGGIGGALIRIGASQDGSLLKNPKSAEISHAFFSQGVKVMFQSIFATHPPLDERIRRIMPDWDGSFPAGQEIDSQAGSSAGSRSSTPAGVVSGLTGAEMFDSVGRPTELHLSQAQDLLRDISSPLLKAARDPFACRALIFFLVLDQSEEIRQKQLHTLKSAADRGVYAETRKLTREAGPVKAEQRLPLVELALPTLRRLSEEQCRLFLNNLESLIKADGQISLFEWCLHKVVTHHLDKILGGPAGAGHLISDLNQVAGDCVVLLSTLVHAAKHSGITPEDVFDLARQELEVPEIELVSPDRLKLSELDRSLKVLSRLDPQAKGRVIKACLACVTADGLVEPVEAELLRAVAATLDVPLPPQIIDKVDRDI